MAELVYHDIAMYSRSVSGLFMNWKKLHQNWNESLKEFYKDSTKEMYPQLTELKDISERYREIELLGQGSQKKVYRVYDSQLKREIALAKPVQEHEEFFEAFISEAILISRIEHQGIITVYDIGFEEDCPYFTMELIEGNNLIQAVNDYSQDELLYIFQQICDAISYAHSKDILNMDLKPENIIVGSFFKVKVLDWGIARDLKNNGNFLSKKEQGTPGFMSPEQITSGEVSVRTDVFMLGAVLFYFLFKKAPFEGKTYEELKENTISGKVVDFNSVSVSEPLVKISLKALSVEPGNRYTTVQDLSSELRRYQAGFATDAENAGFFKQCFLMYKRNMVIMNLVIVSIISGCILLSYIFKQERTQKIEAQKAREKIEKLLSIYEDEKKLTKDLELGIDKALAVMLNQNKSKSSDYLTKTIYQFSSEGNYDAGVTFLLRLLKNDPDNLTAWRHLGFQYFIRQDYLRAAECFGQSSSDHVCLQMEKLARRLHEKFLNRSINDEDLINILANGIDSEKWFWVVAHTLKFHAGQADIVNHLQVLARTIEIFNPGSKVELSYKDGLLDLSKSSGLKTLKLSLHYSLLDSLEIKELKLPEDKQIPGSEKYRIER